MKIVRFSIRQKLLGECIQSLIRLFYKIDSRRKKWSWGDTDDNLKDIIASLYNSECTYDEIENRYEFEYPSAEVRNLSKDTVHGKFTLNNNQIKDFKTIMKGLVEEVKSQNYVHILLLGTADRFRTKLRSAEAEKDAALNSNGGSENKKIMEHGISLVDKIMVTTIQKRNSRNHIDDDFYNVDIVRLRQFRMKPISKFGNELLKPSDYSAKKIPHLTSPEIKTFFRLSRLMLVYFHLEYDGFDRLKICEHETCGKIYFEAKKKSGENAQKYCSSTCRKRAHDSPEKVRCRNRQNAFVRNRISKVPGCLNSVLKDDCEKCDHIEEKGSHCLLVMERNKKVLASAALEKEKRRL